MDGSEPKLVNPDGIQYGVNSLRLRGLHMVYIHENTLWQKFKNKHNYQMSLLFLMKSELTPMIIDTGLTNLRSTASIYF